MFASKVVKMDSKIILSKSVTTLFYKRCRGYTNVRKMQQTNLILDIFSNLISFFRSNTVCQGLLPMSVILAPVSAHQIASTIACALACLYSRKPKHKPKLIFYFLCLDFFLNFYMWRIKFTNETSKKLSV